LPSFGSYEEASLELPSFPRAELVAQIVISQVVFRGEQFVKELIAREYLSLNARELAIL
jgi:hypothetical protein